MQSHAYRRPNDKATEMNTMSTLITKAYKEGFTNDLQVNEEGLHTMTEDKFYKPEEVKIVNFYRFEGESDPADNAIMYKIETTDGVKGVLIDAYGVNSDPSVANFITAVEEINKKTDGNNQLNA